MGFFAKLCPEIPCRGPPFAYTLAQERGEAPRRLSLSWRRPTGFNANRGDQVSQDRAPAREQSLSRRGDHRARSDAPVGQRRQACGELSLRGVRRIAVPAGTQITASPDLNGRRCGIEVGLEHRLVSNHDSRFSLRLR